MVNANEPMPLKFTLPLGVWTFCTSVLTLLASVGLAIFIAFVGIQSFLDTAKEQAELERCLHMISVYWRSRVARVLGVSRLLPHHLALRFPTKGLAILGGVWVLPPLCHDHP